MHAESGGPLPVVIRKAREAEWDAVRTLAYRTFEEFNEGDNSARGAHNFHGFVYNELLERMFLVGQLQVFVAEYDDDIVGMLAMKLTGHISLLFVEGACHRRGIGTALVRYAADAYLQNAPAASGRKLTVNASGYAKPFYERLGFLPAGEETEENGIRSVPMELILL